MLYITSQCMCSVQKFNFARDKILIIIRTSSIISLETSVIKMKPAALVRMDTMVKPKSLAS